jgi:uncharacterized protein
MSNITSSLPAAGALPEAIAHKSVNWQQVAWFLGLAFGLAWLIDLVIYLNGGLAAPGTKLLMQFQMMMPAFAALLLGVFFFKDSPVYFQTNHTTSRWFIYYYFALTLVYLGGAIAGLLQPDQAALITQLLLLCNLPGLILLIVLRVVGKKNAFAGAGMAGGKWTYWLLLGVAVVVLYGLETLLNSVFNLGQASDIRALYPAGAADNIPTLTLLLSAGFNALIIGPLLGLIITFGEEYGWRGFLQSQLVRLGRVKGVLLLGVIWGVWHWPVIWMGYNYPGEPVLGSLMMVAYCVVLAFFLAYAVFKSKGVWTAAYLHALSNQTLSFFFIAFYMPSNILLSFGIGLPGLALCGLLVLLLLRDPVWKETES